MNTFITVNIRDGRTALGTPAVIATSALVSYLSFAGITRIKVGDEASDVLDTVDEITAKLRDVGCVVDGQPYDAPGPGEP